MKRRGACFYAICKPGEPKLIVDNWNECQKLTRGVKGGLKFKGFSTKEDAEDWDPDNGWVPAHYVAKPIPNDAALFRERRDRAEQAGLAVLFTDGSHIVQRRYCGIGIYSKNVGVDWHQKLDHVQFTNQGAEVYALMKACEIYKGEQEKFPAGLCIFTDSMWAKEMIYQHIPNFIRKIREYSLIYPELPPKTEWINGNGQNVKYQDLWQKILDTKEELEMNGKKFEVHWIPRDLNGEADRLSKQGLRLSAK